MPRNTEAKRAYDREYTEKNYARKLELNRLWRQRTGYKNDPQKAIEATRKWQAANPEKVKQARRRCHFKQAYGLSLDEHEAMLLAQNYGCAACRRELTVSHVDHCHATGKIRGILCSGCNVALGHVQDDIERLRSLIRYLEKS